MATTHDLMLQLTARQAATTTANALVRLEQEEPQINWRDILRILKDTLMSIEHEGQFQSPKIRQNLPLIDLALTRLAESAGQAEGRLDRSQIAWFDYLLVYLPGAAGTRARLVLSSYKHDERELSRLNELVQEVNEYRINIARAVDTAVHHHLLQNNEDYRELSATRDALSAAAGLGVLTNRFSTLEGQLQHMRNVIKAEIYGTDPKPT